MKPTPFNCSEVREECHPPGGERDRKPIILHRAAPLNFAFPNWLIVLASWFLFCAAPNLSFSAESVPTNHVLALDGKGAFAELPAELFRGLTNATIECWVRWDHLSGTRRVFNYGRPRRDVSLYSPSERRLAFVIGDEQAVLHSVERPGVIKRGAWCHVAAISGAGGMRLILNGVPLATVPDFR